MRIATLPLFAIAALALAPSLFADEAADKAKQAEQEARFEAYFKQRDTNGDGRLSVEESTAGLDGDRLEQAKKMFAAFDADKDGYVTLTEAKTFMAKVRDHMQEAEKKFTELDTNADGKVTLAEATAGKSGDEATQVTNLFNKIDADHDGFVTKEELRRGVFMAVAGQLQ